jgi:hypothetical protein
MNISLKKIWNDYGIGAIVALLIVAYGVNVFAKYLTSKGSYGAEFMTTTPNMAYSNSYSSGSNSGASKGSSGPQPSDALGQNEVFSSVNGMKTSSIGMPTSCSKQNIQNPSELLPKDSNSQWAQLNPSGKGELANINLLKAGYHIGIDTIGQTLRNANLQIRSEPPNPQLYVGPWNLSTIEPDFMRPPLELGQGIQ